MVWVLFTQVELEGGKDAHSGLVRAVAMAERTAVTGGWDSCVKVYSTALQPSSFPSSVTGRPPMHCTVAIERKRLLKESRNSCILQRFY